MMNIKKKIGTPKYKQIINSIEELIDSGSLKKGDQIPSINKIKNNHNISRNNVLMAFNELKNRGIIQSVVGKGYYDTSENLNITKNIFLLFVELNSFKEDLFNSFLESLGDKVQVEIYFHHFYKSTFSKLISDNLGAYNYYAIMLADLSNTNADIQKLHQNKVYILDQIHKDLSQYPAVYLNFKKAFYLIEKYKKVILIYPEDKQPQGILKGFTIFCNENNIPFEIINSFKDKNLEKGALYIVLDDKTLPKFIKLMRQERLMLSIDIRVISYNDTLLKEIVKGGITTISTDFNLMGKGIAEIILNKEQIQIVNTNNLIIRN